MAKEQKKDILSAINAYVILRNTVLIFCIMRPITPIIIGMPPTAESL